MLVGARGRPCVIGRVDRDPGPQRIDPVDQQRIDIGLDRIEIRRQKQPRAPRVHLVDVVHDLRMPDVVERIDRQLRLHLGERVPVPVVVVPGVMVIQLGWRHPLGGRAKRAIVPPRHDGDAVGVQ